jgi:hypothetical protein
VRNNSKGFAQILVVILLLVLLGGAIYFGIFKNKPSLTQFVPNPTTVASVQPSAVPVVEPTADPTAKWQLYKGNSFTIRLPSNFNQDPRSGGDNMTFNTNDKQPIINYIAIDANEQRVFPTCSSADACYQNYLNSDKASSRVSGDSYSTITSAIQGNIVNGVMLYTSAAPGNYTTLDYFAENNGNVVIFELQLTGNIDNVNHNKAYIDQILSTFKFTN